MESSAETTYPSAISTTNIVFEEAIEQKKKSYLALGEVGTAAKKGKAPHRLVHFSDGVMEEYSTEEEDEDEADSGPSLDPRSLAWLPWLWYYILFVSSGALSVADTCGEKLAWFFGITSPKYQYAIDEFERIKAEEQEEKEMQDREEEAERQRKMTKLGAMEDAVTSVYTPSGEGGTDVPSKATTTGVINAAYLPDQLPTMGGGDKY